MTAVGHLVSKETREKLKKANLGKKLSNETKRKISLALAGNKYALGHKHSVETRERMSNSHKGKKLNKKQIQSLIGNKYNLGNKHSESTKQKMSSNRRGDKNGNWKGGITPINKAVRTSKQYSNWRESVFARDNYTCVMCKSHGCTLNADHIKPFALHPELRFDINNGRTLCVPCHKKTDTYAGKLRVKLATNG